MRKKLLRESCETGISIRPSDAIEFTAYGETDNTHVMSGPGNVAPVAGPFGGTSATSNQPMVGVSPPTPTDCGDDDNEPPDSDNPDANFPAPVMTGKMRRMMEMAIVTELVTGSPVEVIAKNYKVDIRYVNRLRTEWLRACKLQETFDYRHDLKRLSIEAIRDGLSNKGDPFKRMSGGIRVMQGIGEFKPDTINLNVLQRIENIPPELRDRFITSTAEDETGAGVMTVEVLNEEKE